MSTVIIDLGHVNYSSGAVANGFREDFLNKSIGLYAVAELQRHGVTVVTTSGTLEQRVSIEHSVKPDLFVSVHNNAGGADGTEVLYHATSSKGKILAQNILNEIVGAGLNNSRGIKARSDLYVLKNTYCAAALVECAFMDTADIQTVDTEEERKAFGIAIAKGILKMLGVAYINPEPPKPTIPADFNPLAYMTINTDVAKYYAEKHYLEFGFNENRRYK